MKKITLLFAFLLATFSWQVNAQAVEDNFDSYNAGDDPTGWTKYQTETDDPGFIVTDSESNSASNSLYHNDDDIATASTSWIVAPVHVSTGDDMLEFFYRQNYTGFAYDYSGVWYSTTGSDPTQTPGDWTQIAEFNDTDQPYSEDAWTRFRHFFTEAAGTNIYVAFKYTGDYAHEFYIDDFKLVATPAFFPPEFNLTANPDCANSQFSVDVNVTDLGGATSVTVSDDQGSATQQLSATGTVTFGPYPDATNVTFTVTNDQDSSVVASDSAINYCPPSNDDCDNAIALTVNPDEQCGTVTSSYNVNATASSQADDVVGTPSDDVWFTFVATNDTHIISLLNVTAVTGTSTDMAMGLYDGSAGCTGLTLVADSDPNTLIATGLTVGTTYYLRVYGYYSSTYSAQASFDVCVGSPNPAPDCADTPTPADGATAVAVASGRKVVLSWVAPTTGPAPTGYKVEIGTTSGTYPISGTVSGTFVNFIGVSENTTYYWKVTPINGSTEATGCPEWSFTTDAFPAAPANDACANAVALTVDANACATPTVADNSFATDSGEATPSCASYNGGDLWFTVTVPPSGSISVETSEVTGSNLSDTGMAIYSGVCGTLTEIACNDDGGTGAFSKIELTGQNPSDVLLVRVWEYGNNSFGEFNVCAWDPQPQSISDNQIEGFKFFPNPVNNVLNMTAKDNIEAVSITNITGQEVMNVTPNAMETQVNMSQLQNGIYFVKVQVNGQVTAFKVIKK